MDHQGTEIHICVHVNYLQYINASKLKIYISSTTGGTPQDAYEQNDPLIESLVHPLVEAHQLSPTNIYTYTYIRVLYIYIYIYI